MSDAADAAADRGPGLWVAPCAARTIAAACRPDPRGRGEVHLLLAVADHYEPHAGGAGEDLAVRRVDHWVREYPRALGRFRDADGRPPRHTFFYPVETYREAHLDALAELCRGGFGEVEVHLHHDGDDADSLRETLLHARSVLSTRHGLLARRRSTGEAAYAFVHGNWALNNARPDGRWCGVNDEIRVLVETGCYADFTFPSAPNRTQPPTVNRLYYASSTPDRPRGHDRGVGVGESPAPAGSLMLVPGPLLFNLRSRKWGLVPRLENACIQASQPATLDRLRLWLSARVQVPSRPDWYFVKLHAHGAPERDRDALIGPPMAAFHESLARLSADDPGFHVHYVTAREMYNLARAAEAGWTGSVAEARDYELVAGGGEEENPQTSPMYADGKNIVL
jgi:hypothetical protein